MILRKQKGQIVVEYVLLLAIAVSIAVIIITKLVKRDEEDPNNSGALIKKWQQMEKQVGSDLQN